MNKKLLGVAAIIVVALFLLMPVSALSPISTVKEKTTISEILPVIKGCSVIPQSEFVITLDANEEVIWTADYVSGEEDIAYVTGELQEPPFPTPKCVYWMGYIVIARNWWGRPIFYTFAKGWATFISKTPWVFGTSNSVSTCWQWVVTDDQESVEENSGYGEIQADGLFENILTGKEARIYAWVICKYTGGYYGGGDVHWY